jgi:hypothetical protein
VYIRQCGPGLLLNAVYHVGMKTALVVAVAVLLVAACVVVATLTREGQQGGYDYVDEPRRVPKPKICSDYANERQILLDEQAGKLTKADKQWLDMDGDGRYCEERGVAWKGERSQPE